MTVANTIDTLTISYPRNALHFQTSFQYPRTIPETQTLQQYSGCSRVFADSALKKLVLSICCHLRSVMRFVAVQLDEEIDKGCGGVLLVLQLESC